MVTLLPGQRHSYRAKRSMFLVFMVSMTERSWAQRLNIQQPIIILDLALRGKMFSRFLLKRRLVHQGFGSSGVLYIHKCTRYKMECYSNCTMSCYWQGHGLVLRDHHKEVAQHDSPHTHMHARMHAHMHTYTTTTTSPPHNYLTHAHICIYILRISLHGHYHHHLSSRSRMQQAIATCTRTHSLTSPCPCATCNWLLLLLVPKMVITCNLHWWCIFFCQLSQLLMCTWVCVATCIVWLWW